MVPFFLPRLAASLQAPIPLPGIVAEQDILAGLAAPGRPRVGMGKGGRSANRNRTNLRKSKLPQPAGTQGPEETDNE